MASKSLARRKAAQQEKLRKANEGHEERKKEEREEKNTSKTIISLGGKKEGNTIRANEEYEKKYGKVDLQNEKLIQRRHSSESAQKTVTQEERESMPKSKERGVISRGREKAMENHPALTRGLETSAKVLGVALVGLLTYGVGTGAIGAGAGGAGAVATTRAAAQAAINKGATSGAARATLKLTTGQTKNISRVAQLFGKSEEAITKAVTNKLLGKSVAQIATKISAKNLAIKAGKYGALVAGADVLTDWYALDNVMSGQRFYLKDIRDGVADGTINNEQAMEIIEQSKQMRDMARKKVNISTRLNPILWPFRKLMISGGTADEAASSLIEQEIRDLASGEIENPRDQELREREEDSQYYEEQATAKRDTELAQREEDSQYYAEQDAAKEEKDRADTLFYEAIRKRNKGEPLSEEEKNALIERGASIT